MKRCASRCEVYSRVTGYMRPVANWNRGKKEEFKSRKPYDTKKVVNKIEKVEVA